MVTAWLGNHAIVDLGFADQRLTATVPVEGLVVFKRQGPDQTLIDLDALDACPHLLGGGLVEQNVTLATGSGRLVPQIKKSQLGLDTACGMWYTVYITPDGGRA